MSFSGSERVTIGLLIGAAVSGLAVLPEILPEMAIHFGPRGAADQFLPAPIGVVLTPAIGALTLGVLRWAFRIDPTSAPHVRSVVTLWLGLFFAGLQGLLLAWNLGYAVSVPAATGALIGSAVGLVGLVVYLEHVA